MTSCEEQKTEASITHKRRLKTSKYTSFIQDNLYMQKKNQQGGILDIYDILFPFIE